MDKNYRKSFLLLLLIFSSSLSAKELLLVAGWDKPPYVMSSQDSGFEIELMRNVLATIGHDIELLYVPYGRAYETAIREKADISLTMLSVYGPEESSLSLPYVTYQNVVIGLKQLNPTVNNIADLNQYSVIAFQKANKVLGKEFKTATSNNVFYTELPDQRRQVQMLLSGSVDLVVMDVNIFNYFSQLITGNNMTDKVVIFPIFPLTSYRAFIPDAVLREQYNQALTAFKKTDEYSSLIIKYRLSYPTQ